MSEKLSGAYQKTLDKTYLGHWDVPEGGDLVLTIDHFEKNEVKNNSGTAEKKHICYFKEAKPMIVNKTNLKSIAAVLESDKFEDWEGKKIALYAADVKQAESGKGLRVRPYRPKSDELFCEVCGELITDQEYEGKTYRAKAIANNALTKFNKMMCYDCYMLAKAEQEGTEDA